MESIMPRVSVVTIAGADRSQFDQTVQNLEAQSLRDFELVVVDRSADAWHMPPEWDDARLRVVPAPGVSEDAAWNLGFEKCRAEYVAFMAPRHASRPVRLARQAALLDRNPSMVLVGTASGLRQPHWEAPPEPAHTDRDIIHWSLLAGVEMTWSSLMVRRQTAASQGKLLREEFGEAARLDLCLRMCAAGDVARIDEVLTLCPSDPGKPSTSRLADVQRALQAAYAPILGAGYGPIMSEGAGRAAELVARHLVGDSPVPDEVTRDELETVLATLAHSLNPAGGADVISRAVRAAGHSTFFEPGESIAYRPAPVVETLPAEAKAPPRVSVVTVAADPDLLGPTVESVLAQSMRDIELVIVDRAAAGTPPARPSWADERFHVVDGAGLTEEAAWNLGFARSSGAYVAMLAAGSISRPARLARQAAWLDRNEAVVLVGTASGSQQPDGAPVLDPTRTDRGVIPWMLYAGIEMAWSSLMVRRETVLAQGPLLREEYGQASRFDLCHRLCAVGDVTRIDEVLTLCLAKPGVPGIARVDGIRRVLEDAYTPIMAEGALRSADLVSKHVAGYAPVPSQAVIEEIEAVLVSLGDWLKATGKVDGVSRAMIAVERSELMARLARQSRMKAGLIGLSSDRTDGRTGGLLGSALGALWRGRAQPAAPAVPRWEGGRLG